MSDTVNADLTSYYNVTNEDVDLLEYDTIPSLPSGTKKRGRPPAVEVDEKTIQEVRPLLIERAMRLKSIKLLQKDLDSKKQQNAAVYFRLHRLTNITLDNIEIFSNDIKETCDKYCNEKQISMYSNIGIDCLARLV